MKDLNRKVLVVWVVSCVIISVILYDTSDNAAI